MKLLLKLFLIFFKIGAFTFGGGYAMISIIKNEFCEKRDWLTEDEFFSIIAVAESTPGPIAINSATYIGYKKGGVLGSVFATLGVVLPSFIIIFAISLVFDWFLTIELVNKAFMGIQCAVAILILTAGIKLVIKIKKVIPIIVLIATMTVTVLIDIFAWNFSTVFLILVGGVIGLVTYLITANAGNKALKREGESAEPENANNQEGGNK